MSHYDDYEEWKRELSPLQETKPDRHALSKTISLPSPSPEPGRYNQRCSHRLSPRLEVIVPELLPHVHSFYEDRTSADSCWSSGITMSHHVEAVEPGGQAGAVVGEQQVTVPEAEVPRLPSESSPGSQNASHMEPDNAPIRISENVQSIAAAASRDLAVRDRVDSARSGTLDHDQSNKEIENISRSPRLTIETAIPVSEHPTERIANEEVPISPSLLKHRVAVPDGGAEKLPALQPSSPTSPSLDRLPSFKQFTGQIDSHNVEAQNQLKELAEVAIQQGSAMPYPTQPGQTFTTATSPTFSNPAYPPSSQTSPTSHNIYALRSPRSTVAEAQPQYGSPTKYSSYVGPYSDRRPSSAVENGPPSLPSAASSAESYVHAGSGTEGYSTSRTTPIDVTHPQPQPPTIDGAPRPMLPPIPGLYNSMSIPASFHCDFEGCTAPPFQTQYLLSSHKNVHSSSRPHYCPVPDCPRSEGGKGFKRKNEMIRHGLVHDSPGYVCPFCSDREHKYPRPDNLQRFVHHVLGNLAPANEKETCPSAPC